MAWIPDPCAGGIITLIPQPSNPEVVLETSSGALAPGRASRAMMAFDHGTSWVAHYNIHNFGLAAEQKRSSHNRSNNSVSKPPKMHNIDSSSSSSSGTLTQPPFHLSQSTLF
eukprot:8461740-Pyramimonas_sp.AAC.1